MERTYQTIKNFIDTATANGDLIIKIEIAPNYTRENQDAMAAYINNVCDKDVEILYNNYIIVYIKDNLSLSAVKCYNPPRYLLDACNYFLTDTEMADIKNQKRFLTAAEVKRMTPNQIKANYTLVINSLSRLH